ncbi:MAG: PEGA domain-containing protein [Acidobacteria bacterium]|nr:PEGA domain-containing protein [Acidobacteriota bacterium]
MLNRSIFRGILAATAGLILLAGTEAFAGQEKERGPATQMTRGSESSARSSSPTPSRSSATSANPSTQSRGPRFSGSRDNPRSSSRRPQTSAAVSGNSSRSGGRGDHHGYDRHRGRSYHRGGSYYSHYSYYYPRSPFYWYGFYYPFYYGSYGFGYGVPYGHYDYYGPSSGRALGALDLDVRPEKAEVYIDGRFVGVADNFDGFPSYLWLEPGTYEVAFYKEGFETVSREVKVPPGSVIDFNDQLLPGNAVKPEPPPEPVRAAASADSDFERKAEEWRDRARDYKARKEAGEAEGSLDARGEPGRLFLVVRPGDASVYLDGRFLGTGDELARLHSGLIVDPGEHEIEIVRPGYASESKTFSVAAGQELDLVLRLEGGADGA